MRLIDADAYLESVKPRGISDELWKESNTYKSVARMPTIEPQRKKGKWINGTIKKKIEYDYSCSECGRHISVTRGYDVRLVYPFCHCGADMREGKS